LSVFSSNLRRRFHVAASASASSAFARTASVAYRRRRRHPSRLRSRENERSVQVIDQQPGETVRKPEVSPSRDRRSGLMNLLKQMNFARPNRAPAAQIDPQRQSRLFDNRLLIASLGHGHDATATTVSIPATTAADGIGSAVGASHNHQKCDVFPDTWGQG
jgi:hypothetical protein